MWWVVPAAFAAGKAIIDAVQARRQAKENRRLAQFQADANQAALDKQLEYNSPRNQMLRYQEAGLNSNLIYGQGNPGNQSEALRYPDIRQADYQRVGADMASIFNQTAMAQSQVQANDARTRQIGVLTELNNLQKQVLEKNPLLNKEGFEAIISSLVSAAEIKASESGIKKLDLFFQQATKQGQANIVFEQVRLLEQRFDLGELDKKIKAEVLNSKEFQNAILEIQKRFMQDGTVTPQHIYQFIQLLLLKAMSL